MYNYQAPPGQYGQPQYGGFPGQPGAPPGMAPPGMPAPGLSPAPGMQHSQAQQPGGFPQGFQPPPNMPNINFSAPVIRLGTTGPGKPDMAMGGLGRKDGNADSLGGGRRAMGLGFDGRNQDGQRHQMRENMVALQPPTREEIARTIFIGNITDGIGGDEGLQRILATPGGLHRWTRCIDADGKSCSFGFAEYEDADSLGTAAQVLQDIEVPVKKANGVKEGDDGAPETTTLLVVVDENSQKYIEEWRGRGSLKDPADAQFRLDSAKEELAGVLASLARAHLDQGNGINSLDQEGDIPMQGAGGLQTDTLTGEIVTIPLPVDDELSDIPAEMRETVAKEIAAFRDRSNRRDLERLKKEEELEQMERQRNNSTPAVNRLASPPASIATPGGGTNNIPLGPRDRGVQGAPLGPKGFQGVQIPRDYQKGVSFVNGNGHLDEEDDDTDASDEELEKRRKEKKEAELEKLYLDQERRWLNREKSRTAAVQRQKEHDKEADSKEESEKAAVAKRLKEWSDDVESTRKEEEYYRDRSLWLRNRAAWRAREIEADDRDRAQEEKELGRGRDREQDKRSHEQGLADQFLARQAEEIEARVEAPREPQRFKMTLGAAVSKAAAAAAPRRTMAEVEGLLEDEEDEDATTTKRTLVPITFDSSADAGMTEEERGQAARQLATEIPTDKEGLWNWDVKWDFVDDAVITGQLRSFVEKKIVEYLGVQEQMLVEVVEDYVRKRGKPQDLVGELEGALDEEAEVLVKKLWRMLIFYSEMEKRGLSA